MNFVKLSFGFCICLLPTIWAASIALLYVYLGWLQTADGLGALFLITGVLGVGQIFFAAAFIDFMDRLKPKESTRPKTDG